MVVEGCAAPCEPWGHEGGHVEQGVSQRAYGASAGRVNEPRRGGRDTEHGASH